MASNHFLRLLLQEQKNHLLQALSSSIKNGKKPVKVCGRRMSAPLIVSDQRRHEPDHTETDVIREVLIRATLVRYAD